MTTVRVDRRGAGNGRGAEHPGDGTAVVASSQLDAVVDGVARIVAAGANPPARVVVRYGAASVEVEWPVAGGGVVPAPGAGPVDAAVPEQADLSTVTAPTVGTFYRAPEPGAPPFVEVGDVVRPGQQIGIVEAMKLMNAVEADRSGRVVAVLVGDAEPVEYAQPLLSLAPVEE
ncbi:acetyl-CoA carboxylase biotin carboxyl carrier protein [Plantactinospora endophytica]|uniref:Biotin carboxyl carrier protein of acetyl-CoA carboxylase n=1 Tax=Plantactinospora endophytica TaxID=673535 RepID=A0ABQ4EBP9_9ACTN|nr:acetyl-CoA carboxylase biotin carboxyl carrier protein [Plantactinospora endophytica]GIG92075.1 hypothetical protein Pen02_70110 [Plantactinospora endophytica]